MFVVVGGQDAAVTTPSNLYVYSNTPSNKVSNYTLAFSMPLTNNSVGVRAFDADNGESAVLLSVVVCELYPVGTALAWPAFAPDAVQTATWICLCRILRRRSCC